MSFLPAIIEAERTTGRFNADDMRAFADAQIDANLLLGNLHLPAPEGSACGACRFYHVHATELLGECHRHAPGRDSQGYAAFPRLSATDGCGDGEAVE